MRWPTVSAPSTARIDILVNDIWGAEILKGPPPTWNRPMWEHDLDDGLRILRLGIDTHLITSHCLLPLLVARPGGLLVEITDGTTEYNADELPAVGLLRPGQDRGEPARLQPRPRTARHTEPPPSPSHPGWLRSEMMLDNYGVTEDNWRTALDSSRTDGHFTAPPAFAASETPRYVGRGIAAIAADDARARWNQRSVSSAELAREYGFTDIDGRQPDGWGS